MKTAFHADIVETGSCYASFYKNSCDQYSGCLGSDAGEGLRSPQHSPSRHSGAGAGDGLSESQNRVARRQLPLPGLPARGVAARRPQAMAGDSVSAWARRARLGRHVADADRPAPGGARPPGALAVCHRDAAVPAGQLLDRPGDAGHGHGRAGSRRRRSSTATRSAPI